MFVESLSLCRRWRQAVIRASFVVNVSTATRSTPITAKKKERTVGQHRSVLLSTTTYNSSSND